jgi:hypothetical protein
MNAEVNTAMPVAWLFMLLMILVVFAALAAIIWRSWIVGSIVIVFLVLVVGLYFVRARAVPLAATPSIVIVQEETGPVREPWEPDAEMLKTADVYASMEEGVENLALRLCDSIQLTQPPASADSVHIVAAKLDKNTQIVTDIFKEKFPNASVVTDNEHTRKPGELFVTFGITDSGKNKCLKFTARLDQTVFPPAEACVQDTPWVSNIDGYRRDNSKGEWLVGRSAAVEINREAARRQARQDAARKMMPFVTARFPQLNEPNVSGQWLRQQLEKELEVRRFGKEEFVQQYHLPATGQKVYHAAVLVDVSPTQLDRLRNTVLQVSSRQGERVRRFGIGTVGIGFLICLVYLFLNWATRGYFQMNLRLGAFLVLIAGVLLMMLMT